MRLVFALAALSLLSVPANASTCRDTHGKFTKCVKVVQKSYARCRDSKGRFKSCKK